MKRKITDIRHLTSDIWSLFTFRFFPLVGVFTNNVFTNKIYSPNYFDVEAY